MSENVVNLFWLW